MPDSRVRLQAVVGDQDVVAKFERESHLRRFGPVWNVNRGVVLLRRFFDRFGFRFGTFDFTVEFWGTFAAVFLFFGFNETNCSVCRAFVFRSGIVLLKGK